MSEFDIHAACPADAASEAASEAGPDAPALPAATPPSIRLAAATLTADQAALSRRIGRGCATLVTAAGADAVLALDMASGAPAVWRDPVVFSGPFGDVEVEDGARLIRGLCGIDLSKEQLVPGDDTGWLHAAILGRLHGTPFGSAERLSGTGDIPADAVTLRIVLRADHHAFSVHARAGASAWLDLLSRAAWVREKWRHPALPSLPLALPVPLARHTLPAAELRDLRAGDIILPATTRFTCDANGVVSLCGKTLRVRYRAPCTLEILEMEDKLDNQYMDNLDGDELVADEVMQAEQIEQAEYIEEIDEIEQSGHGEENDGSDAAATSPVGGNAGRVPVTLDFHLGHVRTTLAELDTVGPGTVLTLEDGSPASIAIVSGGQALGRGEAIEVNGRLAVRIVQWG